MLTKVECGSPAGRGAALPGERYSCSSYAKLSSVLGCPAFGRSGVSSTWWSAMPGGKRAQSPTGPIGGGAEQWRWRRVLEACA